MTLPEKEHLTNPLAQLKSIRTKTDDATLNVRNLSKVRSDILKLLKDPLFRQATSLLTCQNNESTISQKKLSIRIVEELSLYEKAILHLLKPIEHRIIGPLYLTTNDNNINAQEPVLIKYQTVRRLVALHMQARLLDTDQSALWLLRLPELENHAGSSLRTPDLIIWERENNAYLSRLKILQTIINIERFNETFHDGRTLETLQIGIQEICDYFINMIAVSSELAYLKIKSIRYEYKHQTPKKGASLKLYINKKPIEFSGESATILKILLDNPYNEIEIDEFDIANAIKIESDTFKDDKKYNAYYRKFDDMNTRIALDETLREFGIFLFLDHKKYAVRINRIYSRLIQHN